MQAFIDAHDRLRNIGKPTVARLNGIVVGGGNEFNMACDLAVAVDDIYIRQVGAAHGSVAAGGATQASRRSRSSAPYAVVSQVLLEPVLDRVRRRDHPLRHRPHELLEVVADRRDRLGGLA